MSNFESEVRKIKLYLTVLTILVMALFVFLLSRTSQKRFEEIDVERINIVEKDGKLRLVISNKERQHPGVVDNITFEDRIGKRPPGLMFFNEKGDELGGLVFDGNTDKGQGGSLTFDRFRGDQTIQFLHDEDPSGRYFAGIKMNDQNIPLADLLAKQKEIGTLSSKEAQDKAWQEMKDQGLITTERLRLGRERDKSSVIHLKDEKGRSRIELKVEASGIATLIFLDELGKVIYRLPPGSKNSSHKK